MATTEYTNEIHKAMNNLATFSTENTGVLQLAHNVIFITRYRVEVRRIPSHDVTLTITTKEEYPHVIPMMNDTFLLSDGYLLTQFTECETKYAGVSDRFTDYQLKNTKPTDNEKLLPWMWESENVVNNYLIVPIGYRGHNEFNGMYSGGDYCVCMLKSSNNKLSLDPIDLHSVRLLVRHYYTKYIAKIPEKFEPHTAVVTVVIYQNSLTINATALVKQKSDELKHQTKITTLDGYTYSSSHVVVHDDLSDVLYIVLHNTQESYRTIIYNLNSCNLILVNGYCLRYSSNDVQVYFDYPNNILIRDRRQNLYYSLALPTSQNILPIVKITGQYLILCYMSLKEQSIPAELYNNDEELVFKTCYVPFPKQQEDYTLRPFNANEFPRLSVSHK
jgi:hypothetical protein